MPSRPEPHRLRRLVCGLLPLFTAVLAPGCSPQTTDTSNTVPIGLLLPFTGSASATGSNFERAALYAADRINAGGGVHGRRVRIVARDTHSDSARSKEAVAELVEAGVPVLLGPESADLAPELAPLLAASNVVFVSPLIGAGADPQLSCENPWFRLAPSAQALGEALAKTLSSEGMKRTAILSSTAAYDIALRDAVKKRFTALGGQIVSDIEVDPAAQSQADAVARTNATRPDSIVLATSARTGALVINEFGAASSERARWFLSPLLKTQLFVANVAPEAIEGAIGVAPKIYDTTDAFPKAFAQRWDGDHPLEGAAFYYDAMMMLALALDKATMNADGTIDPASLRATILQAAAPPGEAVQWDEVETGLARQRAGGDIYYSGLTGPMLLDRCGPRRLGVSATWSVRAGVIEDIR